MMHTDECYFCPWDPSGTDVGPVVPFGDVIVYLEAPDDYDAPPPSVNFELIDDYAWIFHVSLDALADEFVESNRETRGHLPPEEAERMAGLLEAAALKIRNAITDDDRAP